MGDASLPPITLEDVAEFHDQLRSLHRAGVELELGQRADLPVAERLEQPLDKQLDLIIAHLTNELSRGKPIEETLDKSGIIPVPYALAVRSWCYGGRTLAALDVLHQPARQRHNLVTDFSLSLLQPVIVLGLSFLAWLYLISFVSPRVAAIYEQMHEAPSRLIQIYLFARQWLAWWAVLLPLAAVWMLWRRARTRAAWQLQWLPGQRLARHRSQAALLASNLADVMNAVPNTAARHQLLDRFQLEKERRDERPPRLPMLQWALNQIRGQSPSREVPSLSETYSLRLTASLYRLINDQQDRRRRRWLPVVMGVLCGGSLVLAYCLALFTPIVGVLYEIIRTSR